MTLLGYGAAWNGIIEWNAPAKKILSMRKLCYGSRGYTVHENRTYACF